MEISCIRRDDNQDVNSGDVLAALRAIKANLLDRRDEVLTPPHSCMPTA